MKEDRWQPPSPLITRGVSGTGRLAWHQPYQERFDGCALLTDSPTCLPSLISILKLCKLSCVRSLPLSSCHCHRRCFKMAAELVSSDVHCWSCVSATLSPITPTLRSEGNRAALMLRLKTLTRPREAGGARHFSSAFQFCPTASPSALKMFLE